MDMIKKMMREMRDEIEGSKEYAKCAIMWKPKDKVVADMYYNMSLQEMNHHNELMSQIKRLMTKEKSEGRPTDMMQMLFDWEHESEIEMCKAVKDMHNMYREQ